MNDIIFQIYGAFILTLAGFVLPILAIAITFFSEGVKLLRENYENEKKQSENNLEAELKKRSTGGDINYDTLEKNISILKVTGKRADKRIKYLSPQHILLQSAIAVGVCLVSFLLALFLYNRVFYIPTSLFIISIIFLVRVLVVFSRSIEAIIEASLAVQKISRTAEEKELELLTTLVDNSKNGGASLFVDPKNISVFFSGKTITSGEEYSFSVNNKHTIKNTALKNSSEYMLKNVEFGIVFPPEFLIESETADSIYSGDKEKIIRFKFDIIQSRVNKLMGDMDLTFLKTGDFNVTAFVKGENLKTKDIKFKIKVVD